MLFRTAPERARLLIAACLCLMAAVVPPRGLAICLGGGHEDGRAAWAVGEEADSCPCEADDSGTDREQEREQNHGRDHRDLEVPSLAEATRLDSGSVSIGSAFEFRASAAATCVDARFVVSPAQPPAPGPPPPRRRAQRSLRAVVQLL